MEPAEAFAWTRNLARTHYENFTVGSWLLPRGRRQHVYNLYAYARTVDDLGDEAEGDRLEALARFEEKLRRCFEGLVDDEPLFVALERTVREFDIPIEPLVKLIEANRMDQARRRQSTFEDLFYYCDFSANPCGHLFLYVFGYRDKARQSLADCTCTALQLTNFWQDIAVDYRKGRIYLPLEDLRRFSYSVEDLEKRVRDPRYVDLMRFEAERASHYFEEAEKTLPTSERRRLISAEVMARFYKGILRKIEKSGFPGLDQTVSLSTAGKLWIVGSSWLRWKFS